MNSHRESAAAAEEDAVAAVVTARTASCFSLCLLEKDKKESKAEAAATATLSASEMGWKAVGDCEKLCDRRERVDGDACV